MVVEPDFPANENTFVALLTKFLHDLEKSPKTFKRYLERIRDQDGPNTPVGFTGSPYVCPLARYMNDSLGVEKGASVTEQLIQFLKVGALGYPVHVGPVLYSLRRQWIFKFIDTLDARDRPKYFFLQEVSPSVKLVTAQQALDVLEAIDTS